MASIENVRAIHQPQRAYEWEVEILGPSTGGLPALTVHANSFSIPELSIETMEWNHKSEKSGYHGRIASDRTLTISFYDSEDLVAYTFFRQWFDTMHNQTTGGGAERSIIDADIILRQLAEDSETVTGRHEFVGAFPTSIGEVSLDYESSEIMTFDMTFYFQKHNYPT